MAKKFRYKHISSVVEDRVPESLLDGEIAVNRFAGKEKLFIKNSEGDIVPFIPEHEIAVLSANVKTLAIATAEDINELSATTSELGEGISANTQNIERAISADTFLQEEIEELSGSVKTFIIAATEDIDELSATTEDISTLSGKVEELSAATTGISSDLNTLSASTTGISSNLNTLSGSVQTLSSSTTGISSNLNTLSAATTGISSNLNTLSASTTDVSSSLNTLSGSVQTLSASTTGISSNLNTLSASTISLSASTVQIENAMITGVTMNGSGMTVTNGIVDLGNVMTDEDDYVITTAINDLNNKIGDIETIGTAVVRDINELSGNVSTLSGNVSTISGNVQTISGNVETISATTENINKELSEINSETDAEFKYRQTGDGTLDKNKVGAAKLEKIKGKSLVWNQMNNYSDYADYSSSNVTSSRNGTKITVVVGSGGASDNCRIHCVRASKWYVSGHKYYMSCSTNFTLSITNVTFGFSTFVWFSNNSDIMTYTGESTGYFGIWVASGATEGTYVFDNLQVIDLTLMFGEGKEPSTVAEFEAMYPGPYYDYNPSTLISNATTGIETVGFNQWDEEWENGDFDSSGTPVIQANKIRSKNFIPIIGGADYYLKTPISFNVFLYDSNHNLLYAYNQGSGTNMYWTAGVHNIPFGVAYLRFSTIGYSVTTYNHDICINLSDPSRNGTYEPYWKQITNIPITTMTGKKDGVGESVVIFPDGLKSAGSVYDEIIDANHAIKRVGEVDLGDTSLEWAADTGASRVGVFYTNGFTRMKAADAQNVSNIVSEKYVAGSVGYVVDVAGHNMTIGAKTVANNTQLFIQNVSFDGYSRAQVQAALAGTKAYYELATPEEYILDEPLTLAYKVDSLGTERSLPEDTSSVVTAPFRTDIKYALNSLDVAEKMDIISANNAPKVILTESDFTGVTSTGSLVDALVLKNIIINQLLQQIDSLKNYVNYHDYVEIGGVKWATMNIGATAVTDYGKYFQWGDISGYTASQVGSGAGQKYFGWADYKWSGDTGAISGMTKYQGTGTGADGKTVLDLSDDAVNAAWGGNWRMPTTEEFAALGSAVNTAWTADYQGTGVAGMVCTDKTDSSKVLFFPAAGSADNGSMHYVGSYGFYWSSSLDSSNVLYGRNLLFYSGYVYWQTNLNRRLGFSLRGVVGE